MRIEVDLAPCTERRLGILGRRNGFHILDPSRGHHRVDRLGDRREGSRMVLARFIAKDFPLQLDQQVGDAGHLGAHRRWKLRKRRG